MIIVDIQGGLGNQLFNYAIGRKISIVKNIKLKLDTSRYNNYFRPYQLDKFKINAEIANEKEISRTRDGNGIKGINKIVFKLRRRILPYYLKPYVIDKKCYYDFRVLKCWDNSYLAGLWQTEKYFQDIRDLLLKEITVKEDLDAFNLDIIKKMQSVNSVSVHIRRGDYITCEKDANNIGSVSNEYYENAINYFLEKYNDIVFFVFSDEIAWVKDNMNLPENTIFLNHNQINNKDYLDMILFSKCKFHIIANSTFSWWGAWLCTNPDKEVIAPKIWWKSESYNDIDVVPESWIRM
ncbi:MAG: alpha-1,2-fucosyltransferase [Bacteroidales bacterium]|nr:alpha-1,2-fucosyltransferase [Bacteroidales bacterium]